MSNEKKTTKTLLLVMDMIRDEGFYADDFISPRNKNTSDIETINRFNRINEIIKLSFPDEARELITADIGDLTFKQKKDRKYWQQQIGSRRNDIRNILLGRKHSSRTQSVLSNLKMAISEIDKMEENELRRFDAKKVISLINSALDIMKNETSS